MIINITYTCTNSKQTICFFIYFQINDIDFNKLGNETDGFSGSDIKEACRQAALFRVHEVLQSHRNLYGTDAL